MLHQHAYSIYFSYANQRMLCYARTDLQVDSLVSGSVSSGISISMQSNNHNIVGIVLLGTRWKKQSEESKLWSQHFSNHQALPFSDQNNCSSEVLTTMHLVVSSFIGKIVSRRTGTENKILQQCDASSCVRLPLLLPSCIRLHVRACIAQLLWRHFFIFF